MNVWNWFTPIVGAVVLGMVSNSAATDHPATPVSSGVLRPLADSGKADDVPVARVNGVAIPRSALVKMMGRIQPRSGEGDAAHGNTLLRDQALRRLILQELVYQEAQVRGMTVGAADIDAAVERIKSSAGGGPTGFDAFLEKEALSEQGLRQLVERNLVLEGILKAEVVDKTVVGEKELRAAYARKKTSLVTPERVSVTEILFLLDPTAKESRRQAAALLKELRDDPARHPRNLVPDGTFVVRDIEIKPADDPVLYAAAKKLKPGEISGVITSQQSLHVIQLNDYAPAREPTFEEVRSVLERDLGARTQQQRLEAWESELRARATIEILVGGEAGK